ncbi:NADH-quinone oxidoreductase subunit NuoF [Microbulbifer guangxiensis]|uniref:NADH-quinone oxidoreductase subunit NuoF n=1 Tax=Microbulbifer guangxiensis TaxID=2904249 RepID=UPI001F00E63C|nr:NADH-quinone oxidoreductase subunit NuoF [Microbulbifer guangxiensis]
MLTNPLTKNIGAEDVATDLQTYRDSDGYGGWLRALKMSPDELTQLVQKAGLRGRGGAGFNTGLKWSFVPTDRRAHPVRYLVCNADEMEPGTFKDRLLMERDPHLLLEGIAIAAHAIGAATAYIFIRGEYHLATQRLQRAIDEVTESGLIAGETTSLDQPLQIYLHCSSGNYICGEETALLNALEGKRAIPRAKPPYPQVSGLWGRPTVVNNVETLCNLPHLLLHGAEWYRKLGRGEDSGTKLFGASGKVNNPGLWELPMGTPFREVIEHHAGGLRDGLTLRGFLPGGGSTDFLGPQHLDLPMDYDTVRKAGSRLGTGTITVLDEATCPIGLVLNLSRFFARESCGWCTPCRDGLPWVVEILQRLENGEGTTNDIELLREHTARMGPGNTFCALAPGAAEPIQSALKLFEQDFIDHIQGGGCPFH